MKNKKIKILKKQVQGITLIALVVTIVLLILVGVAINLTVGDNGLLKRAQNAADTYQDASEREAIELALAGMQIGSMQETGMTKAELENSLKEQFGDEASVEENEDGSFIVTIGENKYYIGDDGGIIDSSNMVEISSVEELKAFRDDVNSGNTYEGKYVYLTNDITLDSNEEWEPIGYIASDTDIQNPIIETSKPFKGIFDGNNNKIENLKITSTVNRYNSLFGFVVEGTLKNVIIGKNSKISGNVGAGIVGYLYGLKGDIINCINYANTNIGGIAVLIAGKHKIYGCKNYGDVSGSKNVGGIVGGCNGVILDSYNISNVNGKHRVGGIVGTTSNKIINCYSLGEINATDNMKGDIVAYIYGSGKIENCYGKNDAFNNTSLSINFKEDIDNSNNGSPILVWE